MLVAGAILTSGGDDTAGGDRAQAHAPLGSPAPLDPTAEAASDDDVRGIPLREEDLDDPTDADETDGVDEADEFCTSEVTDAIATGDPEAVVVAAGGGEAFRDGVVAGRASRCIALNHPAWDWVVVNKQRPVEPIDYAPDVIAPATYSPIGAHLDPAAAAALDAMVDAARDAGAGDIGLESGYRSYDTQTDSYNAQVGLRGSIAEADLTSARPGYSEHQLGLAADLVACDGASCGTMYEFGASPQGAWVADNAWRYGWIVRYEAHTTGTTGYEAEPWHLRYVGVELATAYAEGGYDTYEEFWELPAAPEY